MRRRIGIGWLGVALAIGAAGGAAAQDVSPDILKAQLGEWLVVPDDGRPGCRVRLEAGRTIGGRVAVPAADCAGRQPRIASVSSWDFAQPGIRLSDATRRPVLVFQEDDTTLLKTRGDAVPNFLMVRAKRGIDRAPHAPALFGAWHLQRPRGTTICTVTLGDKPPPGGEESFALATDGRCDPAIRKRKLASWRIEDFAVQLYGQDGEGLRFEPAGDGQYEEEPAAAGRRLLLVKAAR